MLKMSTAPCLFRLVTNMASRIRSNRVRLAELPDRSSDDNQIRLLFKGPIQFGKALISFFSV